MFTIHFLFLERLKRPIQIRLSLFSACLGDPFFGLSQLASGISLLFELLSGSNAKVVHLFLKPLGRF